MLIFADAFITGTFKIVHLAWFHFVITIILNGIQTEATGVIRASSNFEINNRFLNMDALLSKGGVGNHGGISRLSSIVAIHAKSHQFVCSQSLARPFAPPMNQVSFRLFI
jgi:hypothetical protein